MGLQLPPAEPLTEEQKAEQAQKDAERYRARLKAGAEQIGRQIAFSLSRACSVSMDESDAAQPRPKLHVDGLDTPIDMLDDRTTQTPEGPKPAVRPMVKRAGALMQAARAALAVAKAREASPAGT